LSASRRKAIIDVKIAVFRPSPLFKSLPESGNPCFPFRIGFGERYQRANASYILLTARAKRPRRSRTCNCFDEIASAHCLPQGLGPR
jgi:hypothetical protein